jgi:hypothetical protein
MYMTIYIYIFYKVGDWRLRIWANPTMSSWYNKWYCFFRLYKLQFILFHFPLDKIQYFLRAWVISWVAPLYARELLCICIKSSRNWRRRSCLFSAIFLRLVKDHWLLYDVVEVGHFFWHLQGTLGPLRLQSLDFIENVVENRCHRNPRVCATPMDGFLRSASPLI